MRRRFFILAATGGGVALAILAVGGLEYHATTYDPQSFREVVERAERAQQARRECALISQDSRIRPPVCREEQK